MFMRTMYNRISLLVACFIFGCLLSNIDGLTRYARENTVMNMTCENDTVINVTEVSYGRLKSFITCRNADQSTAVVTELCQNRAFCSVAVNDYTFDDVCWTWLAGDLLKVDYECEAGITTRNSSVQDISSTPISTFVSPMKVDIRKAINRKIAVGIGSSFAVLVFLVVAIIVFKRFLCKAKRETEQELNSAASENALLNNIAIPLERHEYAIMESTPVTYDLHDAQASREFSGTKSNYINEQTTTENMCVYSTTNKAYCAEESDADDTYSKTQVETYAKLHDNVGENFQRSGSLYDHAFNT